MSTAALTVRDEEYLSLADGALLARVYQPAGSGPFPVVVEAHGGIWTAGTRLSNEPVARAVAAAGAVVVSLDFRQPPRAGYPASLCDIHAGIRWVRSQAARWHGDPARIGGLGTSTGGHQLLLLAMRPDDPRYAGTPVPGAADAHLDFLVLCWPIVDPWERFAWADEMGLVKFVDRHELYWGTAENMRQANPQGLLDRGEPVTLPPALVIQGTADANIPYEIVERFTTAYAAAGGAVRFERFEGAPHGFIKKDLGSAASVRAMHLINAFVANGSQA